MGENERINGYLYSTDEKKEVELSAEDFLTKQGLSPEEIRKKIIEAE